MTEFEGLGAISKVSQPVQLECGYLALSHVLWDIAHCICMKDKFLTLMDLTLVEIQYSLYTSLWSPMVNVSLCLKALYHRSKVALFPGIVSSLENSIHVKIFLLGFLT